MVIQSVPQLSAEVNRLSASVRRGNNPEQSLCVGAMFNASELASTQPAYLFILLRSPGFQGPANICERQRYIACMQNICDIDSDRFTCWKDDPKPRSLYEGGARWTGWSSAKSEYLRRTRNSINQGGNIAAYAYESYVLVKSADYYIEEASKELHTIWHERIGMNGSYRPETFRLSDSPSIKGDQPDNQPQAEIKIQVHHRPAHSKSQRVWKNSQDRLLMRSEAHNDNTCLTFSFNSDIKQRCYEELLAKWIVRKEGLDQPEVNTEEANDAGWEDFNPVGSMLKKASGKSTQHEETVPDENPAAKESGHRPAEEQESLSISVCLAEHDSGSAYSQWMEASQYGNLSKSDWILNAIFYKMYPSMFKNFSDRAWWHFELLTHIRTMRGGHMYPIIVIRKPVLAFSGPVPEEATEKNMEREVVENDVLSPPKLEQKNSLTPSIVLDEVGSTPVPNNLLVVSNREVDKYIEKEGGVKDGFVDWKGVLVPYSVKEAYDDDLPPW